MLIHFTARQTELLRQRARLHGKSFSQEVRDAVDFYLEMPAETREELQELAAEANCAGERILQRLDKTIAHVDGVLMEMNGRRCLTS
jgi:plasmid stability protein